VKDKKNFLSVITTFFKLGAVSFGGGAALIPVIENELVKNKGWIEEGEFNKMLVVAGISPASLPISLCAIWNQRFSIASAYAYALPGPLIFLALLTGFSYVGQAGMRYVGYASVGIITFVLVLLFKFIRNNFLRAENAGIKNQYIIIAASSFLLSCGGVARKLAGWFAPSISLPPAVFSVSMPDLLVAAFFIIFFIGNSSSKIKFFAALIPSALFLLSRGKAGIIANWSLPLGVSMAAAALASILFDGFKNKNVKQKHILNLKPLRNVLLFVLISAGAASAVFFISKDAGAFDFAFKVATSSLSSFGGGEAYIGVAESVFVNNGLIGGEDYFGRVIGVSSAMPGSVLVSIATGIGYIYGSNLGALSGNPFLSNGIALGLLFGLLAIVITVAATAFGALTLFTFFEYFKESGRLRNVIRCMMPVVCGLLAATSLSLLERTVAVSAAAGVPSYICVAAVALMFFSMRYLSRRYGAGDFTLLLVGGAVSFSLLTLAEIL